MSPRPRNPKAVPNFGPDGRIRTWTIRYRLRGRSTSRTFEHTSRGNDPTRPPREALEFIADATSLGYAAADRRLEERLAGDADHHGPTLDDVFAEFVAWKRPRVKSTRTVEDYEAQYRAISPVLGTRPVDAVTDADIQRWVDGMVAGTIAARRRGEVLVPLHPKTIANYHGLLHAVFDYAASSSRRYVASNPCTGTDLPKRRKGAVKGLRPGEWAALHAALQQVDPDAADLALALYATGARFGEVTALSTWDVEDDGRRVTVNIGHVIRREAGGLFRRVEDTKSEAGFRRVQVDEDVSPMFRRRVLAATPGGLVFTNRHGRMWLPSTFRAYAWLPAVGLANLSRKPTPHWLRHTHVAELDAAGASLSQIQARIGHENIGTTISVYGRLITDVDSDVLDRLAAKRVKRPPQLTGPTIEGELV